MNSNTPGFEMKLDYLRLCSRASDNPGFIWSRENGCVFFWFVAGAEGTPPLVRWGFGPTEPRAARVAPRRQGGRRTRKRRFCGARPRSGAGACGSARATRPAEAEAKVFLIQTNGQCRQVRLRASKATGHLGQLLKV